MYLDTLLHESLLCSRTSPSFHSLSQKANLRIVLKQALLALDFALIQDKPNGSTFISYCTTENNEILWFVFLKLLTLETSCFS